MSTKQRTPLVVPGENLTLGGKTKKYVPPEKRSMAKGKSVPLNVPLPQPSKTKMVIREAIEQMDTGQFLVALAQLGFTIPEIAHAFGIDETRIYTTLNQEPDLKARYVAALETPNRSVEAALFRKAMGFTVYEKEFDGSGSLKKIKTKQVPPDITAIIFWLKNRCLGDKWQDVNKIEVKDVPLADRLTAGHQRIKEKQGEISTLTQNTDGSYGVE